LILEIHAIKEFLSTRRDFLELLQVSEGSMHASSISKAAMEDFAHLRAGKDSRKA
jgi:hypothetical protein